MQLYDSHCHLEAILAAGICLKPVAVPAVTPADSAKLYNYRQHNPAAKIGVGLHPWYVADYVNLAQLETLLRQQIESYAPDFIGECGLDYLKPDFDYQQEVFKLHLCLAQEYHKPIVIHCVRAYNQLLHLLNQSPRVRGIVHAFNANSEMARQLTRKNMFLGIGGTITNANSQLVKSVAKIPLEHLLIESDAPYMPAAGKSFSRSEDCIGYAQRLAELINEDEESAMQRLNSNWRSAFG